VAIPDDVDEVQKRGGRIELPLRVSWSGARRSWDLRDKRQRIQVYEMVLTDGTDDDVRTFIDVDELIRLWPELYLPRHVREAWADFLVRARGVSVEC
jgi:hypothetical protein